MESRRLIYKSPSSPSSRRRANTRSDFRLTWNFFSSQLSMKATRAFFSRGEGGKKKVFQFACATSFVSRSFFASPFALNFKFFFFFFSRQRRNFPAQTPIILFSISAELFFSLLFFLSKRRGGRSKKQELPAAAFPYANGKRCWFSILEIRVEDVVSCFLRVKPKKHVRRRPNQGLKAEEPNPPRSRPSSRFFFFLAEVEAETLSQKRI